MRGHRSPESLIQHLTGSTRADAAKHVRLGESLIAAIHPPQIRSGPCGCRGRTPRRAAVPWHHVLAEALLVRADHALPTPRDPARARRTATPDARPYAADASERVAAMEPQRAAIRAAWQAAAEQLIDEAPDRTVEDLRRDARTAGTCSTRRARLAVRARYEARSFRMWTDENGIRHADIVFDDLGGEWAPTVTGSALRPRRGGPRFVDTDEAAAAKLLVKTTRERTTSSPTTSSWPLSARARSPTPTTVFGARQPGDSPRRDP